MKSILQIVESQVKVKPCILRVFNKFETIQMIPKSLNVLIQWSPNLRLKLVTYAAFWINIVLSLMTPVFIFRNKVVNETTVSTFHTSEINHLTLIHFSFGCQIPEK
jgi:hypothetical protein